MRARQRLLAELGRHVGDERILAAVASVPRERFVPRARRGEAWANVPLPIDCGQTISQPLVVARMCDLLELRGDECVLDVGTGSGWHAAVLSRLTRWVWSIEVHPELSRHAAQALLRCGIDNVGLVVGDGTRGLPEHAPYDGINVAAAAGGGVPPALLDQLAPGGRLVAPVGGEDQRLVRARRSVGGDVTIEQHERVRFVPLVG